MENNPRLEGIFPSQSGVLGDEFELQIFFVLLGDRRTVASDLQLRFGDE